MTEAIEKIFKNFVFMGVKLPHFEIEKLITPERGTKMYVITAHIPENHEIHNSEELADDIMEKMETALSMLGFEGVSANMISRKGMLYIKVMGYYK